MLLQMRHLSFQQMIDFEIDMGTQILNSLKDHGLLMFPFCQYGVELVNTSWRKVKVASF